MRVLGGARVREVRVSVEGAPRWATRRARVRTGAVATLVAMVLASPGIAVAAKAAPAETWATRYCQQIDEWRGVMDRLAPDVRQGIALADRGRVTGAKKAIIHVYRNAAEVSRDVISEMARVGRPEVVNGTKVAKLVATTYRGIAGAFDDAADQLEQAKVKSAEALRAKGIAVETRLQTELDAFADSFGQLATLDTSGQLAAPLLSLAVCSKYFGVE